MTARTYTVSVLLLRLLVHAAVARGVRRDELLDAIGVPPHALDDPEARIPRDVMSAAWEEIPRRLGDEAFSVHLAEAAKVGTLDILDYVTGHSRDLGSVYQKLIRYLRLVHDVPGLQFEIRGSIARFTQQAPPGLITPRHAAEYCLTGPLARGRQLVGTSFVPLEVSFAHPAPADSREHRRFFGVDVAFGRPITTMTLDAGLLSKPILGADPMLSRVVDRYADRALTAQAVREESLGDQVRRLVCTEICAEMPRVADIARRLGMSERTLLRRLRQEELTYEGVVDAVRKEMAMKRLSTPGASPTEVAFFLGFSGVSTFYRAFRRWTGQTPVEFRKCAEAVQANRLAAEANGALGEGG